MSGPISAVQLRALRSASRGTLEYTSAGWKRPREIRGESTSTIESLKKRGLLAINGDGRGARRASITQAGLATLRVEDQGFGLRQARAL